MQHGRAPSVELVQSRMFARTRTAAKIMRSNVSGHSRTNCRAHKSDACDGPPGSGLRVYCCRLPRGSRHALKSIRFRHPYAVGLGGIPEILDLVKSHDRCCEPAVPGGYVEMQGSCVRQCGDPHSFDSKRLKRICRRSDRLMSIETASRTPAHIPKAGWNRTGFVILPSGSGSRHARPFFSLQRSEIGAHGSATLAPI